MKKTLPHVLLLCFIAVFSITANLNVYAADQCEKSEIEWTLVRSKQDNNWYVQNRSGNKLALTGDIKVFDCDNVGHRLQQSYNNIKVHICTQSKNKSIITKLFLVCG